MEFFFNFAWALVAVASVCYWLRRGRRTISERHASLVALALLIVILFPVISVSDDLWAAQNPAETDTSQRRDYRGCCSHSPFTVIADLPELVTAELSFDFQHSVVPRYAQLPAIENPALDPIENRPPPTA
jgi:hypothetical protein